MALDVREIRIGENASYDAVAELVIVAAGHRRKPPSAAPGLIVASQDSGVAERRLKVEHAVAEAAAEVEPGPAIDRGRRWGLDRHVGGKSATARHQCGDAHDSGRKRLHGGSFWRGVDRKATRARICRTIIPSTVSEQCRSAATSPDFSDHGATILPAIRTADDQRRIKVSEYASRRTRGLVSFT